MSITVTDREDKTIITVLGKLEEEEEEKAFLQALKQAKSTTPCQLVIYDARILQAKLIQQIKELIKQRTEPFKIKVYHPNLSYYLKKLGIASTLANAYEKDFPVHNYKALALGGSADSLDKILLIIDSIPYDAGQVVIFIVQHILENKENILDSLLKTHTDYRVILPHQLMPIEAGTIYIAPPGLHMKVSNGFVYLTKDQKVNHARPSIDVLFESLAYEYGDSLIATLLCGYGHDGLTSLKLLQNKDATVIVEDSHECKAKELVVQAKKQGNFDYLYKLKEICAHNAAAVKGLTKTLDDTLVEYFLEALYSRYGYGFRGYQRSTVKRRITKLMNDLGIHTFYDFQTEMLKHEELFERFLLELSINVTSFFRDPDQFLYLRDNILPYLDSYSFLKVWIAGCCSGEEAYSLAILLDELGMLAKCQIFATDINPYLLVEAKNGFFSKNSYVEGCQNYSKFGSKNAFESYFEELDDFVNIDAKLRKNILFYNHSMVNDGAFNEFHVIMCKNVFIYFNTPTQQKVMQLFTRSLHHDGYLIMGNKESIIPGKGDSFFEAENRELRIFRWKEDKTI